MNNTVYKVSTTLDLGCSDLLTDFIASSQHGLANQKFANLLQSQEALNTNQLSADIAIKSADFQAQMRTQANYYTNNIVSELLSLFNLGANFSTLTIALRNILLQKEADELLQDASDIAQDFKSLKEEAESYSLKSKLFNDKLELMYTEVTNISTGYDQLIADIEQTLSQEDKQLSAQVAVLNADVSANIQGILDGSKTVGEGVKQISSFILTLLLVKDDTDSGDSTQYNISGLDSITAGTAEASEAVRELHRNNQKLAELYQEQSKEQSLVSVAQSIKAQNDLFKGKGKDINTIWSEVEAHWNNVADQFSAAATIFANASTEEEIQDVINAIDLGSTAWTELGQEVDIIKRAYSGY